VGGVAYLACLVMCHFVIDQSHPRIGGRKPLAEPSLPLLEAAPGLGCSFPCAIGTHTRGAIICRLAKAFVFLPLRAYPILREMGNRAKTQQTRAQLTNIPGPVLRCSTPSTPSSFLFAGHLLPIECGGLTLVFLHLSHPHESSPLTKHPRW